MFTTNSGMGKAAEPALPSVEEVDEGAGGDDAAAGGDDDTQIEEKDIDLVTSQVNVSREKAIEALKKHKDIVEAIMSLQP